MESIGLAHEVNFGRLRIGLSRAVRRRLTGVGYIGERIRVKAEVEVWNGETHFIVTHNHFVQQGLIHLVNFLTVQRTGGGFLYNCASGYYTMKLGTDTTHITDASMTALYSEIATEPNTLLGLNTNVGLGVKRFTVTATWNAGTVSGTVGELGLRWGMFTTLQGWAWDAYTNASTKQLLSRLSHADKDFMAFTINTGAPLTIEWRVTFSFT